MSVSSKKIRVTDIARLAEVSPATVSKVINGRQDVADATRALVEKIMRDVGFSKPLVQTKTMQTIELVVTYMENNGTIALTREATRLGEEMSIGITVSQTGATNKRDVYRSVIDRNPLGVILLLNKMPDKDAALLTSRNIPFVIIDPVSDVPPKDFSVGIDNWTAGFDATCHLLQLGHRRIGAITGPKDARSSLGRYAGYVAALENEGLSVDPQLVKNGNFLSKTGYVAACELLDAPEPPTAIFAFNDLTAVSIYRAAYERHIRIPDDLSVVGFDNIYPSAYLAPALTTINQPFDLIAKSAFNLILDARAGKVEQRHIVLPTRLVERGSTAELKVRG
ncbi:MAG: substrate-binding domain-containing protein [Bifidobacteriaceae bacterium]|jgi:LacI family transcriptional regulator|nr:substrate-binding domain-containing protein [Bifidobacteriaceae bacterium]MCI1914735.1 substrate-binding domain-containing protein [Bifidobacteriaceae bacterium]